MPVHLHYNITGSGDPVIILHGLFGSSRNWQGMAGRLGQTHRVITVDLRNHGQSGQAASMTYPEMAADVLHLVQQQALENITLIGHSLGGKTAMTCALLQPDAIARLVVLDIAPVAYQHRYGKLFFAMQNLSLETIRNRDEAEKALNKLIADIKLSRCLLQNLVRTDSGYRWSINLATIQDNIEHISNFHRPSPHAVYDRPTLFLGGAESHFLQPDHHPVVKAYFPSACIELIDRAGHMLHIDEPDIVLNRIRQFLKINGVSVD